MILILQGRRKTYTVGEESQQQRRMTVPLKISNLGRKLPSTVPWLRMWKAKHDMFRETGKS